MIYTSCKVLLFYKLAEILHFLHNYKKKTIKSLAFWKMQCYTFLSNKVTIQEWTERSTLYYCHKELQSTTEVERKEFMSKGNSYETQAEELLLPIVERFGVEIYDVEYVKERTEWYLRAYIDKEGGVNIIDCENVSRAFSDVLDEKDFIKDAYILEVSSPGLGRTLKKDKHLLKSIGKEVEIKTYKPINKCKEFAGVLESFDENEIVISENGTKKQFNRADIAIIRLALDF